MKGETFPLLIIEAQSVMLIMPPRSYPSPNARSRTYPLAALTYLPAAPFRRFSYPSLTLPAADVPSVTQSRQDIDSDTHATHKQPGFTPAISISLKIPVDSRDENWTRPVAEARVEFELSRSEVSTVSTPSIATRR